MSLIIIYLIRHGEYRQTVDRQGRVLTPTPQTGLSHLGREQMSLLAEKIRKRGDTPSVFYASPYVRTKESATILRDAFGARLVVDEKLRDSYAPGWCSVPIDELKNIRGDVYSIPPRTADQESYDAMTDRLSRALCSIVAKEKGQTVGLVFHGDPIRVLLYGLEHPAHRVPAMRVLSKSDYLDKGEAWRLVIDSNVTIKEKEYIGRSEQEFGKGGRKY